MTGRGRPRKRPHCTSSVITSDVDRSSPPPTSVHEPGSDSDSSIATLVAPPKKCIKKTIPPIPSASDKDAIVTIKVNYITTVFSAADMKKAGNKRNPKQASFVLSTDEPWDTLKAQFLVRITNALNPKVIDLANYNLIALVTRIVPKPGSPLNTEDEYAIFLNKLSDGKAKDGVSAHVTITELDNGDDKENAPEKDDKKKSKDKPFPSELRKAANIQELQKRWGCKNKQLNCLGKYCYVFDDGTHLALSSECLNCWAFAMVRPSPLFPINPALLTLSQMNDKQATIDTPPNHRLFDQENAILNPVLRKRMNRQQQEQQQQQQQAGTGAAPIINFSFGKEFTDLFRGPAAANAANAEPPIYTPPVPAQNPNAAIPVYTAAPITYDLACLTLLQANRKPGIDMPLEAFCKEYELDEGIRDRFQEHRYKHTRSFRFLTVADMEKMMFMAGEIAEVRDAIDRWSVAA